MSTYLPNELKVARTLAMIQRYTDWINSFNEPTEQGRSYDVKPEDFVTNNSPDPKLATYGTTKVITSYSTTDHDVIVLLADMGDEGGPATITAYFEAYEPPNEYTRPTDDPLRMLAMIQEFDTYISICFNNTTDEPLLATPPLPPPDDQPHHNN